MIRNKMIDRLMIYLIVACAVLAGVTIWKTHRKEQARMGAKAEHEAIEAVLGKEMMDAAGAHTRGIDSDHSH